MKNTNILLMPIIFLLFLGTQPALAHQKHNFKEKIQVSTQRNYCVHAPETLPTNRCAMLAPQNACAKNLEEQLSLKTDVSEKTDIRYELAEYYLYNGQLDEAIEYYQKVINSPRSNNLPAPRQLLLELAIAQLRQGEITNCQNDHNAERCVFPLTKRAYHDDKRGSSGAIETLNIMLNDEPNNPLLRWLLNFAYMTLGDYPEKVPKKYLIPPETFESREKFPRFENIAVSLGFNEQGLAGGVIVDDFNNDGNMDIVMSSFGYCDPLKFFINDGAGGFVESTEGSGLDKQLSASHMVQADFDNDGLLDIYITRGLWENPNQPAEYEYSVHVYNTLMRNTGNGHFVDVTDKVGLNAGPNYNISSIWSDFNNDGFVDLFVCNNMQKPMLFLNQQGQSFKQPLIDPGLANNNMCMGVAAGDINNDGFNDIFLSSVDGQSQLFINKGNVKSNTKQISDYLIKSDMDLLLWLEATFNLPYSQSVLFDNPDNVEFENLAGFKGLIPEGRAFATWFTDYDNDGLLDIFIGGYQGTREFRDIGQMMTGEKIDTGHSLVLHNLGNAQFERLDAGLENAIMVMGSNVGDFNNDGYEDMLLGTGSPALETIMPNRAYLNKEGKTFADITFASGFGNLQKGHGVSFADLDNDGDQDIVAMFGGFYPSDTFFPSIYLNPGFSNHWAILRLEGVKSNRSAIGSRISLEIEENGKTRHIHRILSSGGSFGSNSLQVEVGLGKSISIKTLTIRWAGSATKSVYKNLPIDSILKIKEGDETYTLINQPPIQLKRDSHSAHKGHHAMPFPEVEKK